MYVDFDKYIDYFLKKDRTVLMYLLQEDDFKDEITEYLLYTKQVCPNCLHDINHVTNRELRITDPYPAYEDMFVGYQCDNCGYKEYFS